MQRWHLFEFEDLSWFPKQIRDYMTDFLEFTIRTLRVYDPALPILQRVMHHMQTAHILDLCSGGGGPWAYLQQRLRQRQVIWQVTLSDRFPNHTAFARLAQQAPGLDYVAEAVDATQPPPHPAGVRTIFTGLHHLPPAVVRGILQDAVRHQNAVCFFEFTERRLDLILLTPVAVALINLVGAPWLRPFRLSRLLLTYVIPIVPLAAMWDGLVSQLRSYAPAELHALVAAVDAPDYTWEIGRANTWLGPLVRVTYLVGYPTTRPARSSP